MQQLYISCLEKSRDHAEMVFQLINGRMDSSPLLAKINFRVPGVTRSAEWFAGRSYRRNYLWPDFKYWVILVG